MQRCCLSVIGKATNVTNSEITLSNQIIDYLILISRLEVHRPLEVTLKKGILLKNSTY
ncbi:hypothetical protein BH11BAC2_BH11BAC2_14300 [soil metagenome]